MAENRLNTDTGPTPCIASPLIARQLDLDSIYLKREDMNATGSHKDRSLAFQISAHVQNGKKEFVISSSGNAAISAAAICKDYNFELNIFISDNIAPAKLARLEKYSGATIHINKSAKPLSDAIKFARDSDGKIQLLRGSTDPYAIEGFKTIYFELIDQKIEFDSIFIPTSSGTTLVGIYEAMKSEISSNETFPQLHIVQTARVHPIAEDFDKDFTPSKTSLASAIVDRVAHRKKEVVEAVGETGGGGWVMNDSEILESEKLLKLKNIICSFEGALALAGIKKALLKGTRIAKPVCLITGIA